MAEEAVCFLDRGIPVWFQVCAWRLMGCSEYFCVLYEGFSRASDIVPITPYAHLYCEGF